MAPARDEGLSSRAGGMVGKRGFGEVLSYGETVHDRATLQLTNTHMNAHYTWLAIRC